MDDGVRVCFIKEPTIEDYRNDLREARKTEKAYKKLVLILAVFLVVSIALNFFQLHKMDRLQTTTSEFLYYVYEPMNEEYEFYHNYAVIFQDGVKYYHTYGCPALIDGKGFYIYNFNNAKNYRNPCPDCKPPQ